MDYCDPNSFIGNFDPNYLPSSGGTNLINTKNIDCVSLESNTIITDNLTIGGEPFDVNVLTDLETKTQNQSATAGSTVFTGTLTGDTISTSSLLTNGLAAKNASQITVTAPITSTGSITAGTQLLVNSTSATSDPLAQFFKSTMTTGTNVAVQLGRNSTTAGLFEYDYTGVSTTNYVTIKPVGAQYGPQVTTQGTYVPNKLYVANNEVIPRYLPQTSAIALTTLSNAEVYWGAFSGVKRVVISFIAALPKAKGAAASTTTYIQLGYSATGSTKTWLASTPAAGVYLGSSTGNNGSGIVGWDLNSGTQVYPGIACWNVQAGPADTTGISGQVELTYAGTQVSTTQQVWGVSGTIVNTAGPGVYYTSLAGIIKCPAAMPVLNCIRIGSFVGFDSGHVNYLFY